MVVGVSGSTHNRYAKQQCCLSLSLPFTIAVYIVLKTFVTNEREVTIMIPIDQTNQRNDTLLIESTRNGCPLDFASSNGDKSIVLIRITVFHSQIFHPNTIFVYKVYHTNLPNACKL